MFKEKNPTFKEKSLGGNVPEIWEINFLKPHKIFKIIPSFFIKKNKVPPQTNLVMKKTFIKRKTLMLNYKKLCLEKK